MFLDFFILENKKLFSKTVSKHTLNVFLEHILIIFICVLGIILKNNFTNMLIENQIENI